MGGPAMMRRLNVTPVAAVREAVDRVASRGQASVYLLTSTSTVAAFAVADAVRSESREAIQRLHERHIEVVMLAGDAQAVANAVAQDLGIDTVFAEVLPGDKVDKIKELKEQGKRVAMVGDGVNDAPALVTADVAIAIGAAGYNVFAIPLAAGVLAGQGILLPPAVAAVLMSASTVIVAINAQLLRRATLRRPRV